MTKSLGWKFNKDVLIKTKATPAQTGLSGKQRLENLRGSFAVNPKVPFSSYPQVILFDDVWTTGSTLNEAAKVLKEKGVKAVWGVTFAKG
jgi:predicted amidophosphoribosyltransferase